jgi:hypothetical protein
MKKISLTFLILFLFTSNFSLHSQNKKMLFESLSLKDKVWALKNINTIKKSLKISNTVLITIDSLSKKDKDFYNRNIESGKCDAFRHVLWMYKLSQNIGTEKARRIGKIYENYNEYVFKKNPNSGYDLASMNMDLYNNEVGIYLFLKQGEIENEEILFSSIKEIIEKGYVKIISKDKEYRNLDKNNLIIEEKEWKGKWENQRHLINSNSAICE